MDKNKKEDRREASLIRIGSKARTNLGLDREKTVELWPSTSTADRITKSKVLTIFMAYEEDLKELKSRIGNDLTEDQFLRTGFVTKDVFNAICSTKNEANDIWISDNIDDTVIGGDPEFILLSDDGEVKYAGDVSGFDSQGQLGSDGPLAELRPDPAVEVEEFVGNMINIFSKHPRTRYIKDYEWMAGCCWVTPHNTNRIKWPIGGHIHIGTPSIIAKKFRNDENFKYSVFVTMMKIVDELLAIPFMKIEKKKYSVPRREHYGYFGDYRTDRDRLEYRTLSGAWLAHPQLATFVLGTAKAIIDAYFKLLEDHNFNIKYINEGYDVRRTDMFHGNCKLWETVEIAKDMGARRSAAEMVAILNRYEIDYTKQTINIMHKALKALSTYNKYSKYIDGLIEVVSMSDKDLKGIGHNIKENWVDGAGSII